MLSICGLLRLQGSSEIECGSSSDSAACDHILSIGQ